MKDEFKAPWHLALVVNLGTLLVFLFGYLRDFLRYTGIEKNATAVDRSNRLDYPKLYASFENFYCRNFYRRLCDGWSNPIQSVPGAEIEIMDRLSEDQKVSFKLTGTVTRAINMGSYNYLGFAENSGPRLDAVIESIRQYGPGIMSPRAEFGLTKELIELEEKMANYLGVEAAIVMGMGFATNSNNIPALAAGKGTLIMSDELNHSSLITGCRLAGATCRVFNHNDTVDLERKLRRELLKGQPQPNPSGNRQQHQTSGNSPQTTGYRPWKKIIIVVEGIYSMEGTIVRLPELIRIKKKYKAYLYLDEAHSVGALDKGVVNYFNCDPNDVDILMGTFTKSFGAAGGYIAGSKKLIDYLRVRSHASCYAATMAPPVARQIIGVIDSIVGNKEDPSANEGLQRIRKLRENTIYFRSKLEEKGFNLLGNHDSPVVPLMVYSATIVVEMIRAAMKRNVALVGAGFPATPLLEARVRFCVSSAHTKEMLDHVIDVVDEIGSKLRVKSPYRAVC